MRRLNMRTNTACTQRNNGYRDKGQSPLRYSRVRTAAVPVQLSRIHEVETSAPPTLACTDCLMAAPTTGIRYVHVWNEAETGACLSTLQLYCRTNNSAPTTAQARRTRRHLAPRRQS